MAKISFVSLGCDKNLVDSEVMIGLCKAAGHEITGDEAEAEVIVINTCSFIEDALAESIENILALGESKKAGTLKAIIAAGCLPQRYQADIFKELPEIDVAVGTTAYEQIVEAVESALAGGRREFYADISQPCREEASLRRALSVTGNYYAHLKIAEGCNNYCTYCIIPSLRGKYRSRTMDSLLEEARMLAERGVRELVLVAQDTSCYGVDLYGSSKLPELLAALAEIEDIHWIRLMYCYPENISDALITVMAENEKICNYIDMPIQHISDRVLHRMGRKTTGDDIRRIIDRLREKIEGIAIRTSLIAGFPGETEAEFEELRRFVEDYALDRVGVFAFSKEEGTPAARMAEQIPKRTREQRKNKLMRLQKKIAEEKCKRLVGRTLEVMVEGRVADADEEVYLCRSYMDAPGIDSYVFVRRAEELLSGDFTQTTIEGSYGYDLWGQ